jgi:hemoglobin
MHLFYARAMKDDLIGYIFTDVAKLDLGHHLPIIGDFWETMLFQTGSYAKHGRNPLQVHALLSAKEMLTLDHFTRWLEIFCVSVDELFEGERADFIKMRANAIANRFLTYLSSMPRLETQGV